MVHYLIILKACEFRGVQLYIIFSGLFFNFLIEGKILDSANSKIVTNHYLYKSLVGQVKKHRKLKKTNGKVTAYEICQTNYALFFPLKKEYYISSTKDFNDIVVKYHGKKYEIVSLVYHNTPDNNARHQFHLATTRRLREHTSCTRN